MKFKTLLSNFQKLINKMTLVLPQKSTIPVLEHIYFILEGNKLKAVTSDKDINLMSWIEVEGNQDGSILVPGKKIVDLTKSYTGSLDLVFEADLSNYEIKLNIGDGTFMFKGIDADEYLDIPELFESDKPDLASLSNDNIIDGNRFFSISRKEFVKLCNKTANSVSDDEYRPAMTGVLFEFRENHINAVSTDSYRLSKSTVNLEKISKINDIDVIIPGKSVEFLRKLDEEEIIISLVETANKISHLRFDFGNTVFTTKLIDEKFPPYQQVIPQNNQFELVIDKNQFLHKLKPLATLASKKSTQIKLIANPHELVLTFNDEESQSTGKEKLSCEFNGSDFEVAFNFKFLEDAVNNISEDETSENLIKFTFSEINRPALILPISETNELLMLVMPVRI